MNSEDEERARKQAQLASLRRQRVLLAERMRAVEGNGELRAGAEAMRSRLACDAGAVAEAVASVDERHERMIEGLEDHLRGDLLCMHQLLREQLRAHERRADAEATTCRRKLLLCAAREKLGLLGLHSQGVPVLTRLVPSEGLECLLAVVLPVPRWVAVVSDRWSVVNPVLDKQFTADQAAASASAEHGSTVPVAEGFVSVPASCIERVLVAGVNRTSTTHDTAKAVATGTFAGVSAKQATYAANIISQSPPVQLRDPPYECLASCIRGAAGAHSGGAQMEEGVGYALRCKVMFRQGEIVQSGVEMLGGDAGVAARGSSGTDSQVPPSSAGMLAAAFVPMEFVVYSTHEENLLFCRSMPSGWGASIGSATSRAPPITEPESPQLTTEALDWLCSGIGNDAKPGCRLVVECPPKMSGDCLADISGRWEGRHRLVQEKLSEVVSR